VQISQTVRDTEADVGFLVGEEGQQTILFNERGESIPPLAWLSLLLLFLRLENPAATCLQERGFAATSVAMRRERASLAGDAHGHVWLNDPFPTCDAVATIAKSLQALSHSDARISELL
jgi:hypothetical protein